MALKRPSSHSLRAFAARFPFKASLPLSPKIFLALLLLILVWTIVPRALETTDNGSDSPARSALDRLSSRLPLIHHRPSAQQLQEDHLITPPDFVLSLEDAHPFCSRYHLRAHNESAVRGSGQHKTHQRKIYDLLLISPSTSIDMIELRIASLYPYVDYFILLETPPAPVPTSPADQPVPRRAHEKAHGTPSTTPDQDAPSLLERIWDSHLSAYHAKLIHHSLSQHSHDFKSGLDYTTTTRNALYTRVIPLLTGPKKVELGDVLLVSDTEELVRPTTMKVLRNCHIPPRTTIRTRKFWYGYQWMQIDSPGVTRDPEGAGNDEDETKNFEAIRRRRGSAGNEWWPHPQATVYQGADTITPDDLRKNRKLDQYVFGDGGWTCHLCYRTISETLLKLGDEGFVWFDGPRWKAAGRLVDKATRGVELISRENLSRVDITSDLPSHLFGPNPDRYKYLLNRDPTGANFADFNPVEHHTYLTKQKEVDAEPDFETTKSDVDFNLSNTQDDADDLPVPPFPELYNSNQQTGSLKLSEEDKKLLAELKKKGSLTAEEIEILEQLS